MKNRKMVRGELWENGCGNKVVAVVSNEYIEDIKEVGSTQEYAGGFTGGSGIDVWVKVKE